MIDAIKLRFGSSQGQPALELKTSAVTVFVGPNNAGKSRFLAELKNLCGHGRTTNRVILDSVKFETPRNPDALLASVFLKDHDSGDGKIEVGTGERRTAVKRDLFLRALNEPNIDPRLFCEGYLQFRTLVLDGKTRLSMQREVSEIDLQQQPKSEIERLFRDKTKLRKVQSICYEMFGAYLDIDPTKLGKLRFVFSKNAPPERDGSHILLIDETQCSHFKASSDLQSYSDGVQAFTNILVQLTAGDPRVVLIDEPEAFLHPVLAQRLGKELAIAASESGKRLFVATHSASFLMGCVHSGVPVNVVRLTYSDGFGTARLLPERDLLHLMRQPLLRATRVLDALFHSAAVVVEGDSDRAFYQEVNERMARFDSERAIPGCIFLNAQNKTTIHKIIKPLRNLGIPAAAVVDIDILRNGGDDFQNFLRGGFVPDSLQLGNARGKLYSNLPVTPEEMKRRGIVVFADDDQIAAGAFFELLDSFGLFVLRVGEVEGWLKSLNCPGKKSEWLVNMFGLMGEDPQESGYLRSGSGDVWDFVASIRRWTQNPNRKGIPV